MAESDFDVTRRFVRVLRTLPSGLIEFEFAIGDPDVAVELVMPKPAFEEFCRRQRAELLVAAPKVADANSPAADFQWNLHQATHQRFR